MQPPPPLPPGTVYTSCYCEENVYLLCKDFLQSPSVCALWEIFVVFISNVDKTVALWFQKAARLPDSPVIWDYHVILILRPRGEGTIANAEHSVNGSWVYDFDTSLDRPCSWEEYRKMTFSENLVPAYQSRFRIVHGALYLQNFASDRSHMLKDTAVDDAAESTKSEEFICVYSSPPPTYTPICGPLAAERGITNNLMDRYVAMSDGSGEDADLYGLVLDGPGVGRFFDR